MTLADVRPTDILTMLASVGSLTVTGYFWLVRMNGERPRLSIRVVRLVKVDAARSFDTKWDPVVTLQLAIVNLSTRPNVVLGARAWVRRADGTWGETSLTVGDGAAGAFNVAPQVAEFREVTLELPEVAKPNMPEEEWSKLSWREALEPALGGRIVIRVELVALDGKTFADELTIPVRTA